MTKPGKRRARRHITKPAAPPLPDALWLLTVFDVPDRLGGLLNRLEFKPTRKNPAHWWRIFDPRQDKTAAEKVREKLRTTDLRSSWKAIPRELKAPDKAVIDAQIVKENRMARDALKLAIERRRQAERAACEEVNRRARDVVQRAKGD